MRSICSAALWLWFTVLFANFAEALAEGRSKAQAAALRSAKQSVLAKIAARTAPGTWISCPAASYGAATWRWWRPAT